MKSEAEGIGTEILFSGLDPSNAQDFLNLAGMLSNKSRAGSHRRLNQEAGRGGGPFKDLESCVVLHLGI